MLAGNAPFYSQERSEVYYKVLKLKKFLKIPSKIKINEEDKDLFFKMINTSNNRLKKNGHMKLKDIQFLMSYIGKILEIVNHLLFPF